MYPAGSYRNCTQQTGVETVPRRLVQNVYRTLQFGTETVLVDWYRNCTQKVGTEDVPSILESKVYPAGWYRTCTLQIGIGTVPCGMEQRLYPAGWYICTLQVGTENAPSRLELKPYPAGCYNIPCRLVQNVYPVYPVAGRYLFIYNNSFLHKTVRTSLYGIQRIAFSKQ